MYMVIPTINYWANVRLSKKDAHLPSSLFFCRNEGRRFQKRKSFLAEYMIRLPETNIGATRTTTSLLSKEVAFMVKEGGEEDASLTMRDFPECVCTICRRGLERSRHQHSNAVLIALLFSYSDAAVMYI